MDEDWVDQNEALITTSYAIWIIIGVLIAILLLILVVFMSVGLVKAIRSKKGVDVFDSMD